MEYRNEDTFYHQGDGRVKQLYTLWMPYEDKALAQTLECGLLTMPDV